MVENDNNKKVQNGNGVNTSFSFDFQVSETDGSDIEIYITDTSGNTGEALSSGYLITLNDPDNLTAGGYVTYPYPTSGTKLQTGEKITIARIIPITSDLDLENTGPFIAQNVENAIDKVTMIAQQLNEASNRTLKADISVTSGANYQLPSPVAGKVVGWDATATKFYNYDNPGTAQIAAAASADLAEKWANENEDTEVETGKYSAKHFAAKAEEQVANAQTSADESAASALNAQTYAASALSYQTLAEAASEAANVAAQSACDVAFTTKALMDADLAHDADTIALVTNDPTADNNGIYIKLDVSGSGSWQKSDYDPIASAKDYTNNKVDPIMDKLGFGTSITVVQQNGYWGIIADVASLVTNYQYYGFEIEVIAEDVYYITGRTYLSSMHLIIFADDSYNVISSYVQGTSTETAYTDYEVSVPSGATKMLVATYAATSTIYAVKIRTVYDVQTAVAAVEEKVVSIGLLNFDSDVQSQLTAYKTQSFTKSSAHYWSIVSNVASMASNAAYEAVELSTTEGDEWKVTGSAYYSTTYLIIFTDSSYNVIATYCRGTSTVTTYTDYEATTPAGATKLLVTNYGSGGVALVIKKLELYDLQGVDALMLPWVGKISNHLGDSITAGQYYTGSAQAFTDYGYPYWLKQLLQLDTTRIYGISGTTIATTNSDRPFVTRYADMDDDADMITVLGGVNDYQLNTPMGVFGSTDTSTFYGALLILANGLLTKYPSGKVIFMTPIRKINDINANSAGCTLDDYRNAIKIICEYLAIPVIDLYSISGLSPYNSLADTDYSVDAYLHPSVSGYRKLGYAIASALRGYGLNS